ncbi:MAG TPA: hypothetical protein VGC14_12645 [Rhizobium sp.]
MITIIMDAPTIVDAIAAGKHLLLKVFPPNESSAEVNRIVLDKYCYARRDDALSATSRHLSRDILASLL